MVYQRTFNQWKVLTDNGARIRDANIVTNGSTTMYTVPAGKEFYLFSATLSYDNTAIPGTVGVYLKIGAGVFMTLMNTAVSGDHESIASGFAAPIKLVAGETIVVQSQDANTRVAAATIGYEIAT